MRKIFASFIAATPFGLMLASSNRLMSKKSGRFFTASLCGLVLLATSSSAMAQKSISSCHLGFYNEYMEQRMVLMEQLNRDLGRKYSRLRSKISPAIEVQRQQAILNRYAFTYYAQNDASKLNFAEPVANWGPKWMPGAGGSENRITATLLENSEDFGEHFIEWRVARDKLTEMVNQDESLGGAGEILRKTFAGEGIHADRVSKMIAEGKMMAEDIGCSEFHNPYF